MQVVVPWTPISAWADVSSNSLNKVLDDISRGTPNGQRYSSAASAGEDRAAWRVVQRHTDKREAQCREIIRTWVKNKLLFSNRYDDPVQRKRVDGVYVDDAKRPS